MRKAITEHINTDGKIRYSFCVKIWKDNTLSGWTFTTVPSGLSNEIRETNKQYEDGWGRLKVIANVENIYWHTSIWYDTKMNSYLLPINLKIRKKANLKVEDRVELNVFV